MKYDPLLQVSGPYTKQILGILREERENLIKRIRSKFTQHSNGEELEITILGTSEYTLRQIRTIIEQFTSQIYLSGVSRAINDVSRSDTHFPTSVPAYITKQDQDNAKDESSYPFNLISASFELRNEAIGKVILSRKAGMTTLIEELVSQMNRVWIPRMEEDIRIGMVHSYNAGYFTRVQGYGVYKRWISGSDHEILDDKTVPVDEPFNVPEYPDPENILQKVPGCKMMYPGDISDDPDRRQLIGCFCRIEPVKFYNAPEEEVISEEEVSPEEKKKGRRKKTDDQ